ncbi:WD40-repeat-containing domain protein [Phellopilus nigrolimitatus]|nr:WD40-repeat-containing domain protein [Phellopilus nigrolimitatus]
MARELRPRKARPSYSTALAPGSDDEAPVDDGSSSDDFRPPDNQGENEDDAEGEDDVDDASSQGNAPLDDGDDDVLVVQDAFSKGKFKAKPSKSSLRRPPALSAVLSRSGNRQQHALTMPASDHRHRTTPLYFRAARVERLVQPPNPFGQSKTCSTNNWAFNKAVSDRFSKACGHSVGRGPVWDFMEDRSWWRESQVVADGFTETEATRRPKVHGNVKVDEGLKIIDGQEAEIYLPSDSTSPSMKCFFGLPGKQIQKDLKTFDSFRMSEHTLGSEAHVFNAGGPVWGLDWCPIYVEDHPHRSYTQYIAIAPLPSKSHAPGIGVKCSAPSPACIQIWSFGPSPSSQDDVSNTSRSEKGKERATKHGEDFGETKCEMVLCIDCGPALEIKWCPLPSHDSWSYASSNNTRKLGLLAGSFEDGSLSIFVVPDPEDLRTKTMESPVYVSISPTICIELEETSIWTLDWANSESLAVGCTNGSIAVYNLKEALMHEKSMRDILPTHYISVHQSAVRSLQWVRQPRASADGVLKTAEDPCMIASGGYDGCEILTDLREGCGNIVNRTRDVVLAMSFAPYAVGIITIDLENVVKTFTLSPSILARGHLLLEAGGPIWSLHSSDYHPHLAIGSADGSVLTTNLLKSTRRSASMPFLYYKIFHLDYNRKTGEYRMLEQFLPQGLKKKTHVQEVPDRSTSGKKKSKKDDNVPTIPNTGAWSPEVSVTRVAWNNGGGLARAPLLASATASGLCRIDWLAGQFLKAKVPYGGIEYIRGEVLVEGGEMEEEDED